MENNLQREYPHLLFSKQQWKIAEKSLILLGQCEAYIKAIDNTPILPHHYQKLMNLALLKGAQATTAIEGNTLTDEEIKKIMEGQKLPPSKEYQQIEVKNIIDASNELLREIIHKNVDNFISIDLLCRFHQMVGKNLGEHFNAIPGRLRENEVIVAQYRCPDHLDVPILLNKLCCWLRDEFHYKTHEQSFSEIVIQAIVSHVYIEWIHPFSDGNGRTGRLVEFYILLRGGNPDIASHILSNHYNLSRNEYYRQLQNATTTGDLSAFIDYALLGFRDGLEQTLVTIQQSQFENTWQKLIYDKFDEIRSSTQDDVFKRQRTLALEMPIDKEFTISEIPTLTIALAGSYSSLNPRTILRDIEKLISLDLVKSRDGKYYANTDQLRSMIAKHKPKIKLD